MFRKLSMYSNTERTQLHMPLKIGSSDALVACVFAHHFAEMLTNVHLGFMRQNALPRYA